MYILKAWNYRESTRLIENKAKGMCLRAPDGNEGSPVKTAACDVNDTQQVRINFWKQFSSFTGNPASVESQGQSLWPPEGKILPNDIRLGKMMTNDTKMG